MAIQLFAFPLGGRLSREGSGYHDVRRILDLDERAMTDVARGYVAVAVAVAEAAMTILAHKLDGVGQRLDSERSLTYAIEKQPRCRDVLLRRACGMAQLDNQVHDATRD